ncbi:MAG: peptidase C39 family protein [Elusimicrobiota bacterium]
MNTIFFLSTILNFNIMADNYNRSINYFITDINQVKIIEIKNFEKIDFPNGILKTFNPEDPSEFLFEISTNFYFNEVIFSVSAEIEKEDILSLSVVIDNEEFFFGNFSPSKSKSFSRKNSIGEMNIDTLKLYQKTNNLKARIKIYNNSKKQSIIKLINMVLTDIEKPYSTQAKSKETKKIKINIPKISQMNQQVSYNQDICSPTSLTMVLNYYGIKISTIEVASNVIDQSENIYGNWLFNTIYASTKGLYAFVARINSFKELEEYLKNRIPVIASLTFGPNELKNSPIKKTKGHLVVVKGINENGDIITNDPAASTNNKVEIVYKRKEFENAWLKNKFGTSYIITDDILKLSFIATQFTEKKTKKRS